MAIIWTIGSEELDGLDKVEKYEAAHETELPLKKDSVRLQDTLRKATSEPYALRSDFKR